MIVHAGGLQQLQDPLTGKLAPGVHRASFGALRGYSVTNAHRERIWSAFEVWHREALPRLGHEKLWIGGSYISNKPDPGDVDVLAWIPLTAPRRGHGIADLMTNLSSARLDEDGNVERKLGRVQPMAGLVDGFQARCTTAQIKQWTMNWQYDYDEDTGIPVPGSEKGIVEVIV